VSAKLTIKPTPDVRPFASISRTTFKLGDPPGTALTAGATLYRGDWNFTASAEIYRQSGFADRHYFTLGAGLDF
jgi:hypothetical protein